MAVESFRQTRAQIDLKALAHNYTTLKGLQRPDLFHCPMVKCDGYGHGAVPVSQKLYELGCRTFGVALVEEGRLLRAQLPRDAQILVFGIPNERTGLNHLLKLGLTPVLTTLQQWQILNGLELEETVRLHVKVNTGMNRLGINFAEWNEIQKSWNRRFVLEGICTHLANGKDLGERDSYTALQFQQFEKFLQIVDLNGVAVHALNSVALLKASAIDHECLHKYGARPGISLYGSLPDEGWPYHQHVELLKPVMTFYSEVVLERELEIGEIVSYGCAWKSQRKTRLAVVAAGYGDGYPRQATNKSFALVAGEKVPVVGRICMDYLMLDLTDLKSQIVPGQKVVLFGDKNLRADELAIWGQTIPYHIYTSVSSRVPREYKGES